MYASSRPNPLPALIVVGGLTAGVLLAFAAATGSLIIIIALAALAVALVVVADWTAGIPALLFVSCVDGFIKHYSASSITYVLKDALLALILIGLTLRLAIKPESRPDHRPRHGMLAWAVYFGFLVTQLMHPAVSLAGAFGAFRAHGGFALMFIVGIVYFQQRERLPRVANGVIALCSLCALGAIVQNAMGTRWQHLSPGFLEASLHYSSFPSIALREVGVSGASFRMYSTLVDPAALGITCTYGILTAIAALARLHGIWRLLTTIAIPLMAVGLVLSQTRAAIGALGIALIPLAIMLAMRPETRKFAIGGLLAIALAAPIGIALTHGRIVDRVLAADSVGYAARTRDVSRSEVIYELPSYPFGHGLGATGGGGNLRDGTGFAVDNVYFATLYETGIVGLGTFLVFQGVMLYFGFRAALRAKDVGANTAFVGIVSAQIALLVASWFTQGAFDYAPLAQIFWLFSGAVARGDEWA